MMLSFTKTDMPDNDMSETTLQTLSALAWNQEIHSAHTHTQLHTQQF